MARLARKVRRVTGARLVHCCRSSAIGYSTRIGLLVYALTTRKMYIRLLNNSSGGEALKRQLDMEDKEIKELEKAVEQIWDVARRFGLDPYPTNFEIVPATGMYEVGSYVLPGRYSHWTFGKTYHRMKTMYDFGLSKIYEVVINTNPAYGFLLETNSPIQNKMVIAHVLGHVDFFKN